MERYKVGQLAKTMGISSHTIKHYEKFNLIKPVKNKENNYRYYNMRQCNRILESKKYRNIGFSLKDISQIMNHCDGKDLNAMLLSHADFLVEEIGKLQKQLAYVKKFYEESREMDLELGQWYIRRTPKIHFVKQTDNEYLITDNHEEKLVYEMMNKIPDAKPALYIEGKSLYENQVKYHWGIIEVKDDELDESNSYRSFVTYIKVEVPYMSGEYRLLPILKEKYQEFSKEPISEVYLLQYKITKEAGKEQHYFKVIIPIVEPGSALS